MLVFWGARGHRTEVRMPADRERCIQTMQQLGEELGYDVVLNRDAWMHPMARQLRPGIDLQLNGRNHAGIRLDDFYRFKNATLGPHNPLPNNTTSTSSIVKIEELTGYLTELRDYALTNGHDVATSARAFAHYNWVGNWKKDKQNPGQRKARYSFEDCFYLARYGALSEFYTYVLQQRLSVTKVKKRYGALLHMLESGMQHSLILPLYPELQRRY